MNGGEKERRLHLFHPHCLLLLIIVPIYHSPPLLSPSLSKDEESNSSPKPTKGRRRSKAYAIRGKLCRYHKIKQGGKIITFLTYNGTFGSVDKILAFVEQYDAAFQDEDFLESSKHCNMTLQFQKSNR